MADDTSFPAAFTGFIFDRDKDGSMIIDQNAYLRNLEALPLDSSFSHFRSMHMKLAWLANSFPDCLFEICSLLKLRKSALHGRVRIH